MSLVPKDKYILLSHRQLRRLKHHASILVWAGSNENEKALRQDWFNVKADYDRYYDDFYKLYVRTIKPIGEWDI